MATQIANIEAIISANVYADNDGVAGISTAAEAILDALSQTPKIADWIAYADKLEKVIELVASNSADELKRLHAEEGLRLIRPASHTQGERGCL